MKKFLIVILMTSLFVGSLTFNNIKAEDNTYTLGMYASLKPYFTWTKNSIEWNIINQNSSMPNGTSFLWDGNSTLDFKIYYDNHNLTAYQTSSGLYSSHIAIQEFNFETGKAPIGIDYIEGYNTLGDNYNIIYWEYDTSTLYIFYLIPPSENKTNGTSALQKHFIIYPIENNKPNQSIQTKKNVSTDTKYRSPLYTVSLPQSFTAPINTYFTLWNMQRVQQSSNSSGTSGGGSSINYSSYLNDIKAYLMQIYNKQLDNQSITSNLLIEINNSLLKNKTLEDYKLNGTFTWDNSSIPYKLVFTFNQTTSVNGGLFLFKMIDNTRYDNLITGNIYGISPNVGTDYATNIKEYCISQTPATFLINAKLTGYFYDSLTFEAKTQAYRSMELYLIPPDSSLYLEYMTYITYNSFFNKTSDDLQDIKDLLTTINNSIGGINVDIDQTIVNETTNNYKIKIDNLINLANSFNGNIDINSQFNSSLPALETRNEYKQIVNSTFEIFSYDEQFPATSKLNLLYVAIGLFIILGVIL